jgi:hypothetical protein
MVFMRGSIAAMEPDEPIFIWAMPGEAVALLVAPGLAQAVARVATDKATIMRKAFIVNSW